MLEKVLAILFFSLSVIFVVGCKDESKVEFPSSTAPPPASDAEQVQGGGSSDQAPD